MSYPYQEGISVEQRAVPMGPALGANAMQSRPLANALDELERSIGRLHEDIMFLTGRLEPIRTPQPMNESKRPGLDRTMAGSLTSYVVEQTQRLDQMHQHVAGLTQELDI